jgi:hypothetical protein
MNLTDPEIDTLVREVSHEVMKTDTPRIEEVICFLNPKLADTIAYTDQRKQFILETIIMGCEKDVFDHLTDPDAYLRGKVLVQFLTQFGINLKE